MHSGWKWLAAGSLLFVGSAVALALPWDIDMADSQGRKAYSCWKHEELEDGEQGPCVASMRDLPEGVVSQPNINTPNAYATEFDKFAPDWAELQNPLPRSASVTARGERMYHVYCAPCHGKVVDGAIPELGTVSKAGLAGVVRITGEERDGELVAGRAQQVSDGHIYRVVRKGNAIMPAYGWAMTDEEIWSVVHYIRTLEHGAELPKEPEAEETP